MTEYRSCLGSGCYCRLFFYPNRRAHG